MPDAGATRKKEVPDEELFAGLTEAEKKFVFNLGDFLAKYPNYLGETPYKEAIAVALHVEVRFISDGRPVALGCKICYDRYGRPYCCPYPSTKEVSHLE